MSVFVTSDLHLGHRRLVTGPRGFPSVQAHDSWIIEQWNSVVRSSDVVWVLGDICMNSSALPTVRKLRGIKHLVLGNHEWPSVKRYMEYFNKICAVYLYKNKLMFTHIPVHLTQLMYHCDLVNVHGHTHENTGHPELVILESESNRYFNVNIELHDFKPVLVDDILKRFY